MAMIAAVAMRLLWITAVVAALVSSTSAVPTLETKVPLTHIVHETRDSHDARQWVKGERLPPDALLPMRIGMTQSNIENGYDLLMDVSHPESPAHGRHYTAEQVTELFAPSNDTVRLVSEWLVEHGIHGHRFSQSKNKGWLKLEATVEEAERLLHTTFHEYEHVDSGYKTASCERYHLPENIQSHVDYITPGIQLIAPASYASSGIGSSNRESKRASKARPGLRINFSALKVNSNDTSTCDVTITPACIKALYQIPSNNLSHAGNSLGIFESGSMYSQEDLDLFFANFTPGIPKGTHPTLDSINGGEAPAAANLAGGEADLDFQLAYPIVWPQSVTLYQADDQYYSQEQYTGGIFNTFLDAIDGSYCTYSAYGQTGNSPVFDPVYPDQRDPSGNGYQGKTMCGKYKLTNVISISYGFGEAYLPYYYQQRQCNEFMKLGLQGHTILFASGDGGVENSPGNEANSCLGSNNNVFNPPYPANCPYVTSVGATKVYPGQTVSQPESAANDPAGPPYYSAFSSGGGFSNVYAAPAYQQSAINTYFSKHDPGYKSYSGLHNATHNSSTAIGAGGGVYNRLGRGVPDVAANGDNIAIYNGGLYGTTGGTSASTPIFAAVINLINEHRLAAGLSPVGFINPALYAYPQMLNDITNGSNPGCGTNGFSAVQGWDPVTGLGTPNFPKMLAHFMSLP